MTKPQKRRVNMRCVTMLLLTISALVLGISGVRAQQGERFVAGTEAWEILAPERDKLVKRFENYSPQPNYQIVRQRNGATIVLVFFYNSGGPQPALFSIAPDKTILWRNYEPIETPKNDPLRCPCSELRIAADDKGNILLVWQDTNSRTIKARLFDTQGKALWTQQIKTIPWKENSQDNDYFKHTNALFWPGAGWVVAYSTFRLAVLQLLDNKGQKLWGDGVTLMAQDNDNNPISLIQDSPDSIFALWYEHGFMKKPETVSAFRAQRLDKAGKALWPTPIAVGEAPDFAMTSPREIKLSLLPNSQVKADLYRGMAGDAVWKIKEYAAYINPDGQIQTKVKPTRGLPK